MQNRRTRPISLRSKLWLCILIAVCMALLFALGMMLAFVAQAQKELEDANESILRQNMNQIEDSLRGVDKMTVSFMLNNSSFMQYMSRSEQTPYNRYVIYQAMGDYYKTLSDIYPDLFSFYAYAESSRLLYWDGGLTRVETQEQEEWIQDISSVQQDKAIWQDTRRITKQVNAVQTISSESIVLVRSYPVGARTNQLGFVALAIDVDKIQTMLQLACPGENAEFCIVSPSGQLIAHSEGSALLPERIEEAQEWAALFSDSEGAEHIQVGRNLYSSLQSPYTGWRYVLRLPRSVPSLLINSTGRLLLLTVAGFILLAAAMGWAVSRTTLLPLHRVILRIRQQTHNDDAQQSVDDLIYLEQSFEKLRAQGRELEKEISISRPALQQKLLRDLLYPGMVEDYSRHLLNLRRLGITLYDGAFIVLELRTDRLEGAVQEALNAIAPPGTAWQCLSTGRERCVALGSGKSLQADGFAALLTEQYSTLRKALGDELCIGMGSVEPDAAGIAISYRKAQYALRQCLLLDATGVNVYNQPKRELSNLIHINAAIDQICRSLVEGKEEEVRQDIDRLYRHMAEARYDESLVRQAARQLVSEGIRSFTLMCMDVDWLLPEYPDGIFASMEQLHTISELRDFQVALFEKLGEYIQRRKQEPGSGAKLTARALRYIGDQYCDAELTAGSVAEHLSVTAAHLSRVFKESTGQNLAAYITRLRVDAARRLLEQSDQTVRDIAEQVGYTNAQTFIRAFKKETGLTPGEWRERKKDDSQG